MLWSAVISAISLLEFGSIDQDSRNQICYNKGLFNPAWLNIFSSVTSPNTFILNDLGTQSY